MTYHDVNNPTQLKVFQEQEQQLKLQLAALDQFKTGITNNQDSFNSDDSFGYRQALKDYLTQRQIYTLGSQQITGSQHTNNDKAAKVN
ncbi:bacteriocin secretion accessory protein, partial [Lacticaseibacillus paracasei]